MQRILTWLLVMVASVAAVSFVAAPYVAFFAIRSAADAQDVQGLSQLVDFDSVRASLKTGMSPPQSPAPSVLQDPIGAFNNAIRPIVQPTPPVDPYLTPQGLSNLTRGQGRDAIRPQTPGAAPESPWPAVQYWGFNRCRLTVHDHKHADTVFTFERKGAFSWKLVQVGLPAK